MLRIILTVLNDVQNTVDDGSSTAEAGDEGLNKRKLAVDQNSAAWLLLTDDTGTGEADR